MSYKSSLSIFLSLSCILGALFSQGGLAGEQLLEGADWKSWRTLPVYSDGRIMPLNTYSRILVGRICGRNRPHIVLDELLLANLELERVVEGDDAETASKKAEKIRKRIRELFPEGRRNFEAHELLFSWFAEPEIWEYIPFLPLENVNFRADVLHLPEIARDGKSPRAVAPIQLVHSQKFNDLLEKIAEEEKFPTNSEDREEERDSRKSSQRISLPDRESRKICLELNNSLMLFRNSTFRTGALLEECPGLYWESLQSAQMSFGTVARSWERISGNRLDQFLPKSQSAPRERINAIALFLTRLIHAEAMDSSPQISREQLELRMEILLHLIDSTLIDSENVLKILYPEISVLESREPSIGSSFSENRSQRNADPRWVSYRSDAVKFHSGLLSLRRSLQVAYLSLYQGRESLRVLPALYDDALRIDLFRSANVASTSEIGPWVSLNLVLRAGPRTIRRFVDRDFPLDSVRDENVLHDFFLSEFESLQNSTLRGQIREQMKFADFPTNSPHFSEGKRENGNRKKEQGRSVSVIRKSFRDMKIAYTGISPPESAPSTDEIPLGIDLGKSGILPGFQESEDAGIFQYFGNLSPTRFPEEISPFHVGSVFPQESSSPGEVDEFFREMKRTLRTPSPIKQAGFQSSSAEESTRENSAFERLDSREKTESSLPALSERAPGGRVEDGFSGKNAISFEEPESERRPKFIPLESEVDFDLFSGTNRSSQNVAFFGEDREYLWNKAVADFTLSLRETAIRMEPARSNILPPERLDESALRKTSYPNLGAMDAEYFYYILDPFYWTGIAAASSVVLILAGFLLEFSRKSTTKKAIALFHHSGGNVRIEGGTAPSAARERNSDFIAAGISTKRILSLGKAEEFFLWGGIGFLFFSVLIIFLGGAMRAYISGWAPVSNMYETIVLMSFFAACLGLWFTLQPFLSPPFSRAWNLSAFPWELCLGKYVRRNNFPTREQESVEEDDDSSVFTETATKVRDDFFDSNTVSSSKFFNTGEESDSKNTAESDVGTREKNESSHPNPLSREKIHRAVLGIARIVLSLFAIWFVLYASYYEYADENGIGNAILHSFTASDPIDCVVVLSCLAAVVWFLPRFLLASALFPAVCLYPSHLNHWKSEENPKRDRTNVRKERDPEKQAEKPDISEQKQLPVGDGRFWIFNARKMVLNRKVFVLVGALLVLIAAVATHLNAKEFNPNIRPLSAVIRSNFWLTVHVVAIILGYASGLIAWLLALASLGAYTGGHYRRFETRKRGISVLPPVFCDMLAPYIRKMIKVSVLMLMVGTLLGARWADHSWGRFWSWDVKEVWALITLLVLLLVLHGRIARLYGQFGFAIGAVIGSIAIIMTWYGFNFVFNVGRHAYGHGDSNWANYVLWTFILFNLTGILCAASRYVHELYFRNRPATQEGPS